MSRPPSLKVNAMTPDKEDAQRKRVSYAFVSAAFVLMMSQNVIAPNMTAVATSFNLSPAERDTLLGGWMSTAFFLIGGPMSLIVGYLVDVSNRKALFQKVLLAGSAVNFFTAICTNVWALLGLRALLGGVLGGILPLLFSLFGDLFPPSKRSTVSALVGLASGGGVLIGQVLAGLVGSSVGWRAPYLLVSLMTLGTVVIVQVYAIEPIRGGADAALLGPGMSPIVGAPHRHHTKSDGSGTGDDHINNSNTGPGVDNSGGVYATKIDLASVQRMLSIRSNQFIFLQALPGTIPWGVILVFLNDYLSQDQGFSVKEATFIVLIFGIGAALGGVIGGIAGQRVYNKRPTMLPVFVGVCQMSAVLPLIHIINFSLPDPAAVTALMRLEVYATAFLGGALASVTGPNLKAILLNVNTPNTRGTVFCSQYLADSFGKGVGPYVVSRMIELTGSRATVFNFAMLGWIGSGLLITCVAFRLQQDEVQCRARMRTSLKAASMGSPGGAVAALSGDATVVRPA